MLIMPSNERQAERAWLAERERSSGRDNTRLAEIADMYEKAFTMAIENGFVQDAATAKELSWQARTFIQILFDE